MTGDSRKELREIRDCSSWRLRRDGAGESSLSARLEKDEY